MTRPRFWTDERLKEVSQWMKDNGKSFQACCTSFGYDPKALKKGLERIGEYQPRNKVATKKKGTYRNRFTEKADPTSWCVNLANKYQSEKLV